MAVIYLAGGVFNAAERLHNLYLEKHLKKLGHEVILPQREALKFFRNGYFDTNAIAKDCRQNCLNTSIIYVGCIDGPDADSGTSVEYGMAIASTARAVVYRTDLRTNPEKELGINAMFLLSGTHVIQFPCHITNLDQAEGYYKELAGKIHELIVVLERSAP